MKHSTGSHDPVLQRIWDMEAVVFDMDGVVTSTAGSHARSWAQTFNDFLKTRQRASGDDLAPFTNADYLTYVDGKPRYDGVRSFLSSRGITLPEGDPEDPPSEETVCGLGNRKNEVFLQTLRRGGAEPYPSTVRLIKQLRERGIAAAVITSSRNGEEVLRSAGVRDLFTVKVDGIDSSRLGLAGKPEPDIFQEAARRLGVHPGRAAVVEDAVSGVEAGRRGGFALVIGVDRADHADELGAHGADIVVSDLEELLTDATSRRDSTP